MMITQTVPTAPCWRSFPEIFFVGVVLVTLSYGTGPVLAQQTTLTPVGPGQKYTLEEQLKAGLKAKTKCDKDFLDIVIILVKKGKLPRHLVDSTFLWSRERARRKSRSRSLRPMVYFKPALVLRAKRIGVKLPADCPAKLATIP